LSQVGFCGHRIICRSDSTPAAARDIVIISERERERREEEKIASTLSASQLSAHQTAASASIASSTLWTSISPSVVMSCPSDSSCAASIGRIACGRR
jgi:hypothetical protein